MENKICYCCKKENPDYHELYKYRCIFNSLAQKVNNFHTCDRISSEPINNYKAIFNLNCFYNQACKSIEHLSRMIDNNHTSEYSSTIEEVNNLIDQYRELVLLIKEKESEIRIFL